MSVVFSVFNVIIMCLLMSVRLTHIIIKRLPTYLLTYLHHKMNDDFMRPAVELETTMDP